MIMDTRLHDGDILIEMEDDTSITVLDKKKDEILSHAVETQSSAHGTIHHQNEEFHSASGERFSGVMKQAILKQLPVQEAKSNYMMEAKIVLRCKDQELGRILGETAARWAVKLSQEDLRVRPKRLGATQLFVPFSSWFERVQDPRKRSELHELYRAFRAYMRNHATPVAPLSKKKGVSCVHFISHSLKSAIIERIFPKEQIEKLIQKVKDIESLKYLSKEEEEKKRISKLTQIDRKHFEEFNELFISCQKSVDIAHREKYFAYLATPVKFDSIDNFVARIAVNPEMFEFAGYFCVIKGDKPRAGVLDHDSYLKLAQPAEKGKKARPHDLFINESELARIGIVTTPSKSVDELKRKR